MIIPRGSDIYSAVDIPNEENAIISRINSQEQIEYIIKGMFTLAKCEYSVVYSILSGVEMEDYAKQMKKTTHLCWRQYQSGVKKIRKYLEQQGRL